MNRVVRAAAVAAFVLGAAGAGRADDAGKQKLAEELLLTMQTDKVLAASTDKMLDAQTKQNPQMARVAPVMKKFFAKHMSWDALKGDMAALYAAEFTEAELKELIAFYKTPAGKKLAEKTPTLATKGMELGMARVQAHQAELKEMIEAELKK